MPASNSDARKRAEETAAERFIDSLPDDAPTLTMRWQAAKKMETTVVGLSGWAQSGKDSMGSVLVELGYQKLAFADALRNVARECDPLVEVSKRAVPTPTGNDWRCMTQHASYVLDVCGYEWAKKNTTYREFLQDLGTAVRDHLGEDAWVNACLRKVEDGGKYVITDVRFPNEFAAVQSLGGQVWRINREGHAPPNDHISEHALDDHKFDRTFTFQDCGDDLDALYKAMRALVA